MKLLHIKALTLAFTAMVSAMTQAQSAAITQLPMEVRSILKARKVPASSVSVLVQEVPSGRTVMDIASQTARNPASVMKLVTTLAGLDLLGPSYAWRTDFSVDGPIREGHLEGNLYISGYGDPVLHTEKFWRALLLLRNQGLRSIGGDLVVNQSAFADTNEDPGAFDGQRFRAYNAVPRALVVNFNATRFEFYPDRSAGVVRISSDPPTTGLKIVNQLKLAKGRCRGKHRRIGMRIKIDDERPLVRFTGPYPASCGSHSILRSIEPDERHVYGVFRTLWNGLGGSIDGGVRKGIPPKNARHYARFSSDPLVNAIKGMNKHSNNIMTRQLFLTLAMEAGERPATVRGAREVLKNWLHVNGIDTTGFYIDNGAGLSRTARASARQIGSLLLKAYRSPLMPEFVASFPLSAVDGTLRRRLKKSPLAGRVHMKTGLIKHVRAGAGYLWSKSAKVYSVVVLHNHPGVHSGVGTAVQDALLEWIYEREP